MIWLDRSFSQSVKINMMKHCFYESMPIKTNSALLNQSEQWNNSLIKAESPSGQTGFPRIAGVSKAANWFVLIWLKINYVIFRPCLNIKGSLRQNQLIIVNYYVLFLCCTFQKWCVLLNSHTSNLVPGSTPTQRKWTCWTETERNWGLIWGQQLTLVPGSPKRLIQPWVTAALSEQTSSQQ